MSNKVFADTNLLPHAHDRSAGAKYERARSLIERLCESGGGIWSTQVLQELCVNLRRRTARPLSAERTRELLQDYLSWEIAIHPAESVMEALAIEQRCNISFWDALIIQAAGSAGASLVYSEDLADGKKYGPLRIINPLNHSASE
jgi:predicted nucleic acid-binding protein